MWPMDKFIRKRLQQRDKEVKSLFTTVIKLQKAIRKHRDQRGDDRCWMDDEELYKVLPEGYKVPERDSSVELDLCRRFIASRCSPNTEYVSPQRRIEYLESILDKNGISY